MFSRLNTAQVANWSYSVLESELQQQIRAEASRAGCVLWRNNVGALDGVRYGLANDSRAMNQLHKSADLVGIEPVLITQAMVGSVVGRFLAREVKRPGWTWTGTEREQAQLQVVGTGLVHGRQCRVCVWVGDY